MIKELVMEATNTLPDTATFEDIIDAIYVRLKIEEMDALYVINQDSTLLSQPMCI